MKKISTKLLTCLIAAIMIFTIVACAEVENGSKIQRMKIEIEFLNAGGNVVDTQTATVKLYLNFAPETTAHFIKLAEDGYYNGVTVSHISNTWCEFGGYTFDNGKLVAKDYNYDNLKGEFAKNGLKGNKLISGNGVLIMKRNYNTNDGISQYNSAQATVIMTFSAVSKFKADEYCVFGQIVTDDKDPDYSSSVSNSVDRNGLSSYDKVYTIKDLSQSDDGDKTYYFEQYENFKNDSEYANIVSDYYTIDVTDDSVTHYYKGLGVVAANELLDEELELYKEFFNEQNNYFLNIPYTQVRIKTITKA